MQNGTSASQGHGETKNNHPASAKETRKARHSLARADVQNGTSASRGHACSVARRPTACETPPYRLLLPSPADPKACPLRERNDKRGTVPTANQPVRAEGLGRRRRFQHRKSHAGGVRGNDQSRLSGSSSSSSSPAEASKARNTSRKAVSR